MAIRNILTMKDETLRKKCKPVEKFDEKLWTLLDDMAETLKKANGVGLAAPQVGIIRRLAIIDLGEDGIIDIINPEIIKTGGKQRDIEACLSCPGLAGYVTRPMTCTVKAQDRNGEFYEKEFPAGLLSRCACHEIDHLDGHLFLDIADEMVNTED